MNISPQIIQDLKSRITPVRAIEHYTHQQLKHGRCLCPFHPDRHPSLTVKEGHWQCWSCGEHGDVISFVMKYFSIGFQEAVYKLNDDFGLGLELHESIIDDPSEQLWARIRYECDRDNRQQIAEYRKSISDQIDAYTICHRVLMQLGAPEKILEEYCEMIDGLICEEERCNIF